MMWEEIVKDASGELIKGVESRAIEMRCSLEVAYYILKLEKRLSFLEESVDVQIGRLIEQIDHTQTGKY